MKATDSEKNIIGNYLNIVSSTFSASTLWQTRPHSTASRSNEWFKNMLYYNPFDIFSSTHRKLKSLNTVKDAGCLNQALEIEL